jgi:hypothetical protein
MVGDTMNVVPSQTNAVEADAVVGAVADDEAGGENDRFSRLSSVPPVSQSVADQLSNELQLLVPGAWRGAADA